MTTQSERPTVVKVHPCGCRSYFDEETWASVLTTRCEKHAEPAASSLRGDDQ